MGRLRLATLMLRYELLGGRRRNALVVNVAYDHGGSSAFRLNDFLGRLLATSTLDGETPCYQIGKKGTKHTQLQAMLTAQIKVRSPSYRTHSPPRTADRTPKINVSGELKCLKCPCECAAKQYDTHTHTHEKHIYVAAALFAAFML